MTTRSQVLRSGRKYLGTPYVLGTPSPCNNQGMDCDCFTKKTFNDLGIRLGWWTNQLNYGKRIAVGNRAPSDLLFFSEDGSGKLTHIGIQDTNGYLIHSSYYFDCVARSKLKYMKGLYAVRRLI